MFQRLVPAVALFLLSICTVWADGCFMSPLDTSGGYDRVSSSAQKAIIIREGKREVLLLQTTYSGPANEFAWVVPVPGRPEPSDVFSASQQFMDGVFLSSQPRVETQIVASLKRWHIGPHWTNLSAATTGGSGPGDEPTVTVWSRMQVGHYDVAVLSATGASVLSDWLNRNGFGFPATGRGIAAEYVAKGWYFVALRLTPEGGRAQPITSDTKPIGIRFPSEKLVFPLSISRISAPERTSLTLVVLAPRPVTCRELPVLEPATGPEGTSGPGACYGTMRRQMLTANGGKVLLCETRAEVYGDQYGESVYRETERPTPQDAANQPDSGAGESGGAESSTAPEPPKPAPPRPYMTRFVGLLPISAMSDLTFTYTDAGPFYTTVVRSGQFEVPLWIRVVASPVTQVGTPLLFATLLVVWVLRRQRRAPDGAEARGPRFVLQLVVAALLLGFIALRWAVSREGSTGRSMLFGYGEGPGLDYLTPTLVLCAAVAIWWLGLSLFEGASKRAVFGAALLTVAAWFSVKSLGGMADSGYYLYDASRVHMLAYYALLSAIAFAASATLATGLPPRARWHHAVTWGVIAAALATPPSLYMNDRLSSLGPSDDHAMDFRLDTATKYLERTVNEFRDQTGCYPRRLIDLTTTSATTGLDASGNELAIRTPLSRPVISELPTDPLTGKTDTWVYDLLTPGLVESGGYTITVSKYNPEAPEPIWTGKP